VKAGSYIRQERLMISKILMDSGTEDKVEVKAESPVQPRSLSTSSSPLPPCPTISSIGFTDSSSPAAKEDSSERVDYDSDCLVIVECDPADYNLSPGDALDMSQGSESSSINNDNNNSYRVENNGSISSSSECRGGINISKPKYENNQIYNRDPRSTKDTGELPIYTHKKLHNLPIHELKRKLAYCPVCQIQCPSHKIANLCLNKHGKRQCWLCLEVMSNTKDSYFQHCVANHAVRPSSDMVACPYCNKFFDFRQGINQHIVKVHFSEDTSFFNTTACLSPGSLVDIYTGQSRSSNSTGSSCGGGGASSSFDKEDGSPTVQPSLVTIPEDGSSVLLEDIKIIRNPQEGVGGTVAQVSALRRQPIDRVNARESVIRETPAATTFPSSGIGPVRKTLSSTLLQNVTQVVNSSRRATFVRGNGAKAEHSVSDSNNYDNTQIDHFHTSGRPQSHPQPSSQSIRHVYLGMTSLNSYNIEGESSLTVPQRPNSDPICIASSSSALSNNGIEADYGTLPVEYCSHATNNIRTQRDTHQRLQEIHYTHETSEKPSSLQDMQKMVDIQEDSKVPMDYFNSVKTMLKTVADFGPKDNLDGGEGTSVGDVTDDSLISFNDGNDEISGGGNRNAEERSSSSENQFKTPSHAGVKRRILTKWDEHQEKKEGPEDSSIYYGNRSLPYPTISSSDNDVYSQRDPICNSSGQYHHYSHHLASLENSLRSTGGMQSMTAEDRQFWEQVIKESTAMYRSGDNPAAYQRQFQELHYLTMQQSQMTQTHLEGRTTHNSLQPPSYSHRTVGESQYPRIMQKVDSHGKPVNCNGLQMVSSHENNGIIIDASNGNMSSSQLMVYSPTQTQKQYEYRIIPQATCGGTIASHGNGSIIVSPNQQIPKFSSINTSHNQQQQHQRAQSDQPVMRKRKSSFPNRVVQSQISPCDSVLVQNPFEEEEVTYQCKSNKANGNYFPQVSHENTGKKQKLSSSPRRCPTISSNAFSAQAHYDALQLHQQLLQHQQNVQIQINDHHHQTGNIVHSPIKFGCGGQLSTSTEYHFQQQHITRLNKAQRMNNGNGGQYGDVRPFHPQQTTSYPSETSMDDGGNGVRISFQVLLIEMVPICCF
jgi:uncharacterized Zn-finger protein